MLIDLLKVQPMIATLAMFTALQGLSLTLRPTPGCVISGRLTDLSTTQFGAIPVMFIAALIIALGLELMLFRSRFGIAT